jgi:NAD(P)-dependent dehydrogenase (short-subunit alcohol dehydrogenase family)
MAHVLVTGANRGIGLSLVEAHRARGDHVVATCRKRSPELDATGATVLDGVELSDPGAPARIVAALGATRLDRVVLNAGILRQEDLAGLDGVAAATSLREQFEVNALAPLALAAALRSNCARGAKIGFITSRMGSIADNGSGGWYGYRMSKAALNAGARSLALDLKAQEIAVYVLHPGFVRTGMTGGRGDVTPTQSAANLVARLDALTAADSGTFWHADGTPLPW